MRHDIIKTDNYLLVVDESVKEINNGEYFLLGGKHINMWAGSGNRIMTELTCKIISHRPFNGAPYLGGVDVLPLLNQEDDIEKLFNNCWIGKKVDYNTDNGTSFKEGYNIAREKYKFTEEDLRKGIKMSIQKHPYAFDGKETKYKYSEDEIIQSIQQPKLPIAFECEIEPRFKHIGSTKEVKGSGSRIKNKHAGNPKTFINSEGRTEWVGKYIYE